jgi:hypothetical protein
VIVTVFERWVGETTVAVLSRVCCAVQPNKARHKITRQKKPFVCISSFRCIESLGPLLFILYSVYNKYGKNQEVITFGSTPLKRGGG